MLFRSLDSSPDRRTARARLVRCVAAVAVLIGVVLLPCADGMGMAADQPVAGPGSMHAAEAGMPLVDAAATAPGPGHLGGGLLAACMVLLGAVLATVVGLRLRLWLLVGRVVARPGVPRGRLGARSAPSLAELCLSRT